MAERWYDSVTIGVATLACVACGGSVGNNPDPLAGLDAGAESLTARNSDRTCSSAWSVTQGDGLTMAR